MQRTMQATSSKESAQLQSARRAGTHRQAHRLVATSDSSIVGTASLAGSVMRSVFVAPVFQARGIGKLLMAEIDRTARTKNTAQVGCPFFSHR
ncbi:GNAT family N-acetyltransferase [Bradyrhizobium lablabi]|uniref:GNAT family N-acetyltransferase n=1 Tax=Bradyrhizobium lablabi TaxID=722472 RepID=UPI0028965A98|nr:GNAT family N-acetyltransferase [Bradyrhizobium lablabi]